MKVYTEDMLMLYPCGDHEPYRFSWSLFPKDNAAFDWHYEDAVGCCVIIPALMDTPLGYHLHNAESAVYWIGY